MEDINSKT